MSRGAHWYEVREIGLGAEFLSSVDAVLQLISRHPELFPATYGHVRQCMVKRFPFSVVYSVEENRTIVLSVFHASRDPRIWKRRT